MFFLYLILAATGITVLINTFYSYKKRKEVFTLWDRNAKLDSRINYHQTFKNFYENMKRNSKEDYCVDDITWNDLNMNKIFEEINYTFTSPGEETLFYRLKKAHESHLFDENLINKITNDRTYRVKLSLILSRLGKSTYADSSKYIFGNPDYFVKKNILFSVPSPLLG